MPHPALKQYFETELSFLGPTAAKSARACVAMAAQGFLEEARAFELDAVNYSVRAAHAAHVLFPQLEPRSGS